MAQRSLYLQIEGDERLIAVLARLRQAQPVALAMALHEEAEATIDHAVDKLVPKDFGTLAGSHYVLPPVVTGIGARVVLGFGGASAPYAAAVHDNPRAGKTGGVSPSGRRYRHWATVGESEYLEKALAERARGMNRRLAARIRRDWEKLLR